MQSNLTMLLNAASYRPLTLQGPSAWVGHLPFAWWLIQMQRPRTLVELGTHTGNSYFTFCQAVKDAECTTACFAVDTWQGDEHAGEYDEDIYQQVDAINSEHYAAFSKLLRMTFDQALDVIPDGTVDLLHIDGLHTYEAVRHDFETWLPKLSADALVLFHDTNVYERGFGVWQFWKEICSQYSHKFTFEHSHGLGVLQVGNGQVCPTLESARQLGVQTYFAALGNAQLDRFYLSERDIRLQAEKVNAEAQILYRDALVAELKTLIQAEKDNAEAQILYRDALVAELKNLLQLEKDHCSSRIACFEKQLDEAYSLKGLMRHFRRKLNKGPKS